MRSCWGSGSRPNDGKGGAGCMKFNYYYGSEADQFSFIRIPKIMLIENAFQTLSMAAKVL